MTVFTHEIHEEATDEYGTPLDFHRPIADAVGGFDLDPAAGAERRPLADRRFTADDDGLTRAWDGKVWLNPPFSEKALWVRRAREQVAAGNVQTAVVLLSVDTSTDLFHRHLAKADLICFRRGRLAFDGGGDSPNFGVLLAVFGEVNDDLLSVLQHMGTVFENRDMLSRSEQSRLPIERGGGGSR